METLTHIANAWWTIIVPVFLQATIVAMALLFIVKALPRLSSPLRYWLLVLVLMKFAMPPLGVLPTGVFNRFTWAQPATLSIPGSKAATTSPTVTPLEATETAIARTDASGSLSANPVIESHRVDQPTLGHTDAAWKSWFFLFYLAGVLFALSRIALNWLRLKRLIAGASPATDGNLLSLYSETARQLGMTRLPRLLVSDNAASPIAFGCWRPRILLPRNLAVSLDLPALRTVLAHELAHHSRRDVAWAWIQLLLGAVWWFHPLFWATAASLRRVREECCDDMLLAQRLTTRDLYCSTLLDAARVAHVRQKRIPFAATPGLAEQAHPLARRLCRIRDARLHRATKLSFGAGAAVFAAALVLLPGGASTSPPDDLANDSAQDNPSTPEGSMAEDLRMSANGESQDLEERPYRSFDVGPGGSLNVRISRGNLEIVRGSESQIRVETHLDVVFDESTKAEKEHESAFQRFRFDHDGLNLGLFGGFQNPNHKLRISIPMKFDVNLSTGLGNISLEHLTGQAGVYTGRGNVSLGEIHGPAEVKTSRGNITLSKGHDSADLKAGQGDISVNEMSGDASFWTGKGNIRLGNISGDLSAGADQGDISLEDLSGAADICAGRGDVSLGEIRGPVAVKASQGNITLSRGDDSADLKAGRGDISVDEISGSASFLTGSGNIRLGDISGEMSARADQGNITLKHGKGDIQVSVSRGNATLENVRGDIEASASRGNITLNHVEGDASVSASHGNIMLNHVSGDVEASANRGNIATTKPPGEDNQLRVDQGRVIILQPTGQPTADPPG